MPPLADPEFRQFCEEKWNKKRFKINFGGKLYFPKMVESEVIAFYKLRAEDGYIHFSKVYDLAHTLPSNILKFFACGKIDPIIDLDKH